MRKYVIIFIMALAILETGCAQANRGRYAAIAFYNCENFFDTQDDPAKEDEEFTPGGKYHYTDKIYSQKQHNIATVIASMNGGKGPAVIGLAEVENDKVLNDLVQQPELRNKHYKYVWYTGPDPRGITVALLYDPSVFTLIGSRPMEVDLQGTGGKSRTRDVLYVKGAIGGDTLHILVNHWPSRIGGEQSNGKREIAAMVNRRKADELLAASPAARIVIMGDLNDNPDNASVATVLGATGDKDHMAAAGLYDPFAAIYTNGGGTEAFRHEWNLFDQIIVSAAFLKKSTHLQYDHAEVYKPVFIVDTYKGHEGEPHRSFAGTRWINGYSDHFPVVMYLLQ